jgi:hypothetical protein
MPGDMLGAFPGKRFKEELWLAKSSRLPGMYLSKSIDSRLNVYGMAAAAASVGLLALAEPAQSEVVITNKNIPIPACNLAQSPCSVSLDLNGDGVNDFKISLLSTFSAYGYFAGTEFLRVTARNGGGVMGTAGGNRGPYASALLRGAKIGASDHFLSGKDTIEDTYFNYHTYYQAEKRFYGKWEGDHPNRFLGVKFKIGGKTHYGWIRITVKSSLTHNPFTLMSATITEYGYETIANKSLGAGLASTNSAEDQAPAMTEPPRRANLGMLALGAEGLDLWRREEVGSLKPIY